MPPRIATANALIPNSVPIPECTLNSGAISRPANPARAVDNANENAIASRTLDPSGARHPYSAPRRAGPCRSGCDGSQAGVRCSRGRQRNNELKRKYARAKQFNRLLRENRREGSRLLSEGEQDDIVEHDAASHRRHQPAVRAALGEGTHQRPLDDQTEKRESVSAVATASGSGQPSRMANV